jgi:phosphoribosyl 1,2-cyclic phosphodiesterase
MIDSVKLSIASDLGSVTPRVVREMAGSDMMLIEANYDEKMLMDGEYPEFLKQAIKGDNGHLSNSDAGTLARSAAAERTRDVMLVHLSKENNTPELARSAVESALGESAKQVRLTVAEHGVPSGPYALR